MTLFIVSTVNRTVFHRRRSRLSLTVSGFWLNIKLFNVFKMKGNVE